MLNVKNTSVRDNFFELGGHSLLITQLISRIRETFGVALPIRAVFEAPTIASLSGLIDEVRAQHVEPAEQPITPVPRGRYIVAS